MKTSTILKKIVKLSLLTFFVVTGLLGSPASAQTYCTTNLYYYGCIYDNGIDNFQITNLNHISSGCSTDGYEDFTTSQPTIQLNQGVITDFSITYFYFADYFAIWIDLNDDGDFDDANEFLFTLSNLPAGNYYNDHFTVPVSAPLGTHRLRIRLSSTYSPLIASTSCDQFYFGETHDYNIVIGNSTTLPLCPTVTFPDNGSTNVYTNTDISWSGDSDAVSYDVYFGTNPVPPFFTNQSSKTFSPGLLASNTTYFYQINPVNSFGTTSCSVKSFTTGTFAQPCHQNLYTFSTPCIYAYIDDFILPGINHTGSGCSVSRGYGDFTSSYTATLNQGVIQKFYVSLTGTFSAGIWIDLNDDADFDDSGECIFTGALNSSDSSTLKIPDNATLGTHILRIRISSNNLITSADACTEHGDGETQDYLATISATTIPPTCPLTSLPASGSTGVFTNKNISWDAGTNAYSYNVYFGTVSSPPLVSSNQITTVYSPGTMLPTTVYYYRIEPVNPNGSASCAINSFTTAAFPEPCKQFLYANDCNSYGPLASISDFSFAGISNLGSVCPTATYPIINYNDFTSYNATVEQLGTYYFHASLYGGEFAMWIDANDDGDFDYTELLYYNGSYSSDSVYGNLTIPSATPPGTHLLRIRTGYYYLSGSGCDMNSSYGEAEDYSITVLPLTHVPTCPDSYSLVDGSTILYRNPHISYSGQAYAETYDVYFGTSSNPTFALNQSSSTYYPGVLLPNTTYYYKINPVNSLGTSSCNVRSFTTGTLVQPCIENLYQYGCTYWYVDDFALTTINQTGTGCTGTNYNDFTSLIADVKKDSTYSFSMNSTGGFTGIWIDLNDDGDFDDANENVYDPIYLTSGPVSDTIHIPLSTPTGLHIIRVRFSGLDPINSTSACSSLQVGETQDYLVNVLPSCIQSTDASIISSSGGLNLCNGNSTLLEVVDGSLGTGATWNWYTGSCGGTLAGTGNSLMVSPTSTTSYFVRAESNCNNTLCAMLTINVQSIPPSGGIVISNVPTAGCVGGSAVLTMNSVSGASFYRWSGPSGVLFNGNAGPYDSNVPSVTVNFTSLPSAGSSGWSVCVFAGNPCGNTGTKCSWIRATISKPSGLTGSTIGCPNTSSNYSVYAVSGAASYQWTATGGATITGNGSQAVSVNFPSGFVSGTLCVHAQTSCGYNSADACLNINRASTQPGVISGASYVCPSASSSFSIATVSNASTYTWSTTVPGAVVTPSGTSCTILFPVVIPAGSQVCVSAVSSCGYASASRCKGIANGLPGTPSSISGPSNGQCGQSGVSYSITPVAYATGYSWSTSCGTISGPNNLSGVSVDWPSNFTNCSISVAASNGCGMGGTRTLTVSGIPNTPVSISGNTSVCANDVITYCANGSTGATSYIWTIPGGTTILGPATGSCILLQWGATGGNVTCRASNDCGSSTIRTLAVNVTCRESQVKNTLEEFHAEVFPNPADEKVTVKFYTSLACLYRLTITDITGRIILTHSGIASEGINVKELALSGLAKGIYMLGLEGEVKNETIRLVVQ